MYYSPFLNIYFLIAPTYTQVNSATSLLDSVFNNAKNLSVSMQTLWGNVLNSPLYFVLARLGSALAVGTLMLFFVQWAKALIDNEDSRAMSDLIWPLIVIFLLSNNAAVLRSCTYGMRVVLNRAGLEVLASTTQGIQLQSVLKQKYDEYRAQNMLQRVVSQCNKYPDTQNIAPPSSSSPNSLPPRGMTRKQCVQNAISVVQANVDDIQAGFSKTHFWQSLVQKVQQVGSNGLYLVEESATFIGPLKIVLFFFSTAFQIVVEITWVLTALLAPLAVGLTLLPVGQRAIFTWVLTFCSVGLVKICYQILVGLTATVIATSSGLDSLTFALIVGLLSPILAVAMAAGGGMAIMNSINAAAQSSVGLAVKAFTGM